jgi:hypothetical protein
VRAAILQHEHAIGQNLRTRLRFALLPLWWEVATDFCSMFHMVDGTIHCNIAQELYQDFTRSAALDSTKYTLPSIGALFSVVLLMIQASVAVFFCQVSFWMLQ